MSGLEWTPDVSIYRHPWRESTGACLQAPAGEGITMTDVGLEALDLLSMEGVAKRLGVSEKTVQRMIRQGVFTKLKVGSLVRIDEAEVVAYIKLLHEQAAAAKAS
jgi:excisionase family DNA binding protein